MSSREILEEGSDDDSLTGTGLDNLVDEEVPHPKIRKSYNQLRMTMLHHS